MSAADAEGVSLSWPTAHRPHHSLPPHRPKMAGCGSWQWDMLAPQVCQDEAWKRDAHVASSACLSSDGHVFFWLQVAWLGWPNAGRAATLAALPWCRPGIPQRAEGRGRRTGWIGLKTSCRLKIRQDSQPSATYGQQADSLTLAPECPGRQTSRRWLLFQAVGSEPFGADLPNGDGSTGRVVGARGPGRTGFGGESRRVREGRAWGRANRRRLSAEAEPESQRLEGKKTAPPCRHAAAQKAALGDADANAL